MAIAEQFAGIQMDKLIGAPLSAAADASIQLAGSTADFINRVGFEPDGRLRNATFGYQSRSVNKDGTINHDEMKIDVPMLAIVPIPNLQVDEVNILFDMEVKQSQKQENGLDLGATASGNMNFGVAKVNITGNVSAHSSNTRSSDNSAKYHVDVRATNHGTPEGLARVLDMMASGIAPVLTGTTIKDANGQELDETERQKAARRKVLHQEIQQLENCLNTAKEGLAMNLSLIKKTADTQQKVYQANMICQTNALNQNSEADQKKAVLYAQSMEEVNKSWNLFKDQASDYIKMVAGSGSPADENMLKMFALKQWKNGKAENYEKTESGYKLLVTAQKNAIASQKQVNSIEAEIYEKKNTYIGITIGRSIAAVPEGAQHKTEQTATDGK